MRWFVLSANIRRYEALLLGERAPHLRALLEAKLVEWRRELAEVEAPSLAGPARMPQPACEARVG